MEQSSSWFENHPFIIVGVTASIFVGLLLLSDSKITKHYKKVKEIEKRKKLRQHE